MIFLLVLFAELVMSDLKRKMCKLRVRMLSNLVADLAIVFPGRKRNREF